MLGESGYPVYPMTLTLSGQPTTECWSSPRRRRPVGPLHAQKGVGWQPSHFLTDRAEAERAYALAEQLGSVNAAASQLGTTWPSLRKAFTRHGLGMPARNPEAVRQRAAEAARQRTGQPATPPLASSARAPTARATVIASSQRGLASSDRRLNSSA
jgi:hypothetical protein